MFATIAIPRSLLCQLSLLCFSGVALIGENGKIPPEDMLTINCSGADVVLVGLEGKCVVIEE